MNGISSNTCAIRLFGITCNLTYISSIRRFDLHVTDWTTLEAYFEKTESLCIDIMLIFSRSQSKDIYTQRNTIPQVFCQRVS